MFGQVKELLDEKVHLYNSSSFIPTDPISIPHLFSKKEDIEIAGFFAATIAWGQRKTIMDNARKLMLWMDDDPHNFIVNAGAKEYKPFQKFVHRTFNGEDCIYFMKALKHIYTAYGSLETVFVIGLQPGDKNIKNAIAGFRNSFFEIDHPSRTKKHVSNPAEKSSAKRLCMYLRWMVRKDKCGVDFGIWNAIKPSQLCLPLDVHTGNVGRKLGLIQRKQNDWQTVEEITTILSSFDKKDPVKYDFALFGLGAFDRF